MSKYTRGLIMEVITDLWAHGEVKHLDLWVHGVAKHSDHWVHGVAVAALVVGLQYLTCTVQPLKS